ncbi:hypothetical protein C8F04DRAFT_1194982 [Mycena alexandri]|uniref:Uncharacterized protein n=1 Tax=Mycena alexandri TaxID=1745969 RepID=A0AAD6S666_9AGAR|nr:hypothetical protein C8F04DRAFT_1194982 [Mycena alexandri]
MPDASPADAASASVHPVPPSHNPGPPRRGNTVKFCLQQRTRMTRINGANWTRPTSKAREHVRHDASFSSGHPRRRSTKIKTRSTGLVWSLRTHYLGATSGCPHPSSEINDTDNLAQRTTTKPPNSPPAALSSLLLDSTPSFDSVLSRAAELARLQNGAVYGMMYGRALLSPADWDVLNEDLFNAIMGMKLYLSEPKTAAFVNKPSDYDATSFLPPRRSLQFAMTRLASNPSFALAFVLSFCRKYYLCSLFSRPAVACIYMEFSLFNGNNNVSPETPLADADVRWSTDFKTVDAGIRRGPASRVTPCAAGILLAIGGRYHPWLSSIPSFAMARSSRLSSRRSRAAPAFSMVPQPALWLNMPRVEKLRYIRGRSTPEEQIQYHVANAGLYARDGRYGDVYCCAEVDGATFKRFRRHQISRAPSKIWGDNEPPPLPPPVPPLRAHWPRPSLAFRLQNPEPLPPCTCPIWASSATLPPIVPSAPAAGRPTKWGKYPPSSIDIGLRVRRAQNVEVRHNDLPRNGENTHPRASILGFAFAGPKTLRKWEKYPPSSIDIGLRVRRAQNVEGVVGDVLCMPHVAPIQVHDPKIESEIGNFSMMAQNTHPPEERRRASTGFAFSEPKLSRAWWGRSYACRSAESLPIQARRFDERTRIDNTTNGVSFWGSDEGKVTSPTYKLRACGATNHQIIQRTVLNGRDGAKSDCVVEHEHEYDRGVLRTTSMSRWQTLCLGRVECQK